MNTTRVLALVVALLAAAFGIFVIVTPDGVATIGRHVLTPMGLYVIAALRVVIGLILVRAASASRMPTTLRVLGIVIVIAGMATPIFGVERSRAVMEWEVSRGPAAVRLLGVAMVAAGAFLAYASSARRMA